MKRLLLICFVLTLPALLVGCGSDNNDSSGGGAQVVIPPGQGDALVISPEMISDAEVQKAYLVTITATGGFQPYTFSPIGNFPPGMVVNQAGSFGGVPTQVGDYNFSVRCRDAMGNTATRAYDLKVVASGALPEISTPSIPTATFGGAYSVQLAVNGGTGPYTFSDDGGFPANITLAANGLLSGVAAVQGSFPVTLMVEDVFGAMTMRSLTFEVTASQAGPQILTTQPAAAFLGQPYSFQFMATSGSAPYVWSTPDPLPAGLVLMADGTLMGVPTTQGQTTFLIVVTDSANVLSGVLVTVTVN